MHNLDSSAIEEFHQVGWIVIEDLFQTDEIEEMKNCFNHLENVARELKTTQTYQNSYFVLGEKNQETIIKRVVWAAGVAPYLLKIGTDPRIVNPVSQLLDSKTFDHLLNQAHFKRPSDGVFFAWHQDIQHRDKQGQTWNDIQGWGSYVQTALVIDEMTEDNGPLMFAKGSSQWGKVNFGDHSYDSPQDTQDFPPEFKQDEVVTVSAKAGSLLLFGPYTAHASFENSSAFSRRILINGYAYPGANKRIYPGSGLGVPITLD
jgi:ectoine hydroxylase-related dioxygenase (phytanoyl-CoA dioxygenase family)